MEPQKELRAFERCVADSGPDLDLTRAALALAAVFEPGLDTERYALEVESLGAQLSERFPPNAGERARLDRLVHFLFDDLGFRGNADDYGNARNSFLDQVLDRKLGIPITLSLLAIEVGRRAGLELEGVGYPGHFLVRWTDQGGSQTYLDPFHGGGVVERDDLAVALVQRGFQPAHTDQLLAAVTKRQLLSRMLTNLKINFALREQAAECAQAIELLLLLSPWDLGEHRDRGLLALTLGRPDTAVAELETYLAFHPDAPDTEAVQSSLLKARQARSSTDPPPA